MSLLAVILVLREHKALQKTGGLHLSMAVLESWLLIHTVFTLRYAGGGLVFPGGDTSFRAQNAPPAL